MASQAQCVKCKIRYKIKEHAKKPLRELECCYCHGPLERVYPNCRYPQVKPEPLLRQAVGAV